MAADDKRETRFSGGKGKLLLCSLLSPSGGVDDAELTLLERMEHLEIGCGRRQVPLARQREEFDSRSVDEPDEPVDGLRFDVAARQLNFKGVVRIPRHNAHPVRRPEP